MRLVMAIASIVSGLSLDRFADILQIHPLHFNQVQWGDSTLCGVPVLQYAWQSADRSSRENVAMAINHAESLIETYLGYPLSGKWFEEEHTFKANQSVIVQANHKYIRSGGIKASSLIATDQTITYSDVDSDTYKETATI